MQRAPSGRGRLSVRPASSGEGGLAQHCVSHQRASAGEAQYSGFSAHAPGFVGAWGFLGQGRGLGSAVDVWSDAARRNTTHASNAVSGRNA
jgi:hypothetical protein